jgi:hypothetical protein
MVPAAQKVHVRASTLTLAKVTLRHQSVRAPGGTGSSGGGHSNRPIADPLFIAEGTAGVHVAHRQVDHRPLAWIE